MESLQLTNEHKSKLLEMCKKLFPHLKDIYFENGYICVSWRNERDLYKNCDIHWFEFCCKKLAFKIYNFNIGKTKTTYSTFVGECIITSSFHPVDYLYEEFKKLKL